jgi:hypothetical protein
MVGKGYIPFPRHRLLRGIQIGKGIMMKIALTYVAALALMLVVALALQVHVYNGQNKGFTYGNCGIEVVGEPGHFCGDY